MDYDIEPESYIEMKRFGDDIFQLGHKTVHLRYQEESGSAATASTSRWPDGTEVVAIRFPSRADPHRFVNLVAEDDNLRDYIVTTTPDGSGEAGVLGVDSEEISTREFTDEDDLISITAGYREGEDDRYRLSFGNEHLGDVVSEEGASTVSIIGQDLDAVKDTVGRYVSELHQDTFTQEKAVSLVDTALDAFPDEYEEARWMTRGVPGVYTFPSRIPIND